MLFKWTPNFVPNKIFIFGCGGTGSRVVPLVSQFIKSCPWVVNPEVVLIDFDIVEEKNLTRQNFIVSDIGKNKAVVLAGRYSKAFNVTITPITSRVSPTQRTTDAEDKAYSLFNSIMSYNERRNAIFILCVDSPTARREIVEAINLVTSRSPNNLIIDAGNGNDFGQIVLSSPQAMDTNYDKPYLDRLEDKLPLSMNLQFIPLDPGYFDNMAEVTTASCAELDQTMAINTLMAVNIFGIVQNIYYVKPISFFRINVHLQHGSIPEHISIASLKQTLVKEKRFQKLYDSVRRIQFYPDFSRLLDEQSAYLRNRELDEIAAKREAVKEDPVSIKKKEKTKVDAKVVCSSSSLIDSVINQLASMQDIPAVGTTSINNQTVAQNVITTAGELPLSTRMR